MNIFSLLKSIESRSRAKCLSCEGEIITYLYQNGPSRPVEIVDASRHSHVNVFKKLAHLCKSGVLDRLKDHEKAKPIYKLNGDFKVFLDAQVVENANPDKLS